MTAVVVEAGPALAQVDHLPVQAPGRGADAGVVSVGEVLSRVQVGGSHPLSPSSSAGPQAVAVTPGVGDARQSPLEWRSWQTETGLEG